MNNLVIPVKTSKQDYFLKVLRLLDKIQPFSNLRPKELELFANLLFLNDKYKDIPEQERNEIIFSKGRKEEITKIMNISMEVYYNLVMALRKNGLITENSIVPKYRIPELKEITFKIECTKL